MLTKLLVIENENNIQSFGYNETGALAYTLSEEKNISGLEAIYVAKITSFNKKTKFAYINAAQNINGVINLRNTDLQPGSHVLCQLVWQGDANKLPKFSEDIKFIGKYVIVVPNTTEHIFSKQITAEPYDISDKYLDTGLIFRSSIENVTNDKLIENEIDFLIKQAEIIKTWQQLPPGLHNPPTYKFMQLLREAKLSPKTEVYTNSQVLFDQINPYTNLWQFAGVDLDKSLAIPCDEVSIKVYAEFGLELHKLSGINLIDINSKNAPLSFFSVNYLAIDEIVRQILLQDLTGIILLDFIKNMSMFDQQKLLAKLTKCLSNDWRRNQILGFTKAGICEIIRNK